LHTQKRKTKALYTDIYMLIIAYIKSGKRKQKGDKKGVKMGTETEAKKVIKAAYTALKLKEAIYLMGHHKEGGYFDACGQVVLFEGKKEVLLN